MSLKTSIKTPLRFTGLRLRFTVKSYNYRYKSEYPAAIIMKQKQFAATRALRARAMVVRAERRARHARYVAALPGSTQGSPCLGRLAQRADHRYIRRLSRRPTEPASDCAAAASAAAATASAAVAASAPASAAPCASVPASAPAPASALCDSQYSVLLPVHIDSP